MPTAAVPGIEVRLLTAADAPAYRDLMLHAYAAAPDAFTSTPEERAREPLDWWVRRIGGPATLSRAFGAFAAGGALVGAVALEGSAKPKNRHKAHLVGMFVRETMRGHGAGRALVEAALAHARDVLEIEAVDLTVTEGNAHALQLYRACGFREWGVEPKAVRLAAGFKAKVHMTCDLASR